MKRKFQPTLAQQEEFRRRSGGQTGEFSDDFIVEQKKQKTSPNQSKNPIISTERETTVGGTGIENAVNELERKQLLIEAAKRAGLRYEKFEVPEWSRKKINDNVEAAINRVLDNAMRNGINESELRRKGDLEVAAVKVNLNYPSFQKPGRSIKQVNDLVEAEIKKRTESNEDPFDTPQARETKLNQIKLKMIDTPYDDLTFDEQLLAIRALKRDHPRPTAEQMDSGQIVDKSPWKIVVGCMGSLPPDPNKFSKKDVDNWWLGADRCAVEELSYLLRLNNGNVSDIEKISHKFSNVRNPKVLFEQGENQILDFLNGAKFIVLPLFGLIALSATASIVKDVTQ